MKIINTKIKDLLILKSQIFKDKRGALRETYRKDILDYNFPFDIVTSSKKNVIRGLHFQSRFSQAKLITVTHGKILDVVVDLRKKSKTFGKIFKIILSKKNALGLHIPAGFAHGYYSFEKENIIYYKLDNYYNPKYESGIIFNDKTLKIKWPRKNMIVSSKDQNLITISQFKKKIKYL